MNQLKQRYPTQKNCERIYAISPSFKPQINEQSQQLKRTIKDLFMWNEKKTNKLTIMRSYLEEQEQCMLSNMRKNKYVNEISEELAKYRRPKDKKVEDILIDKGLQSKQKLMNLEKEIYNNYWSHQTLKMKVTERLATSGLSAQKLRPSGGYLAESSRRTSQEKTNIITPAIQSILNRMTNTQNEKCSSPQKHKLSKDFQNEQQQCIYNEKYINYQLESCTKKNDQSNQMQTSNISSPIKQKKLSQDQSLNTFQRQLYDRILG